MDEEGGGDESLFGRGRGPVLWLVSLGVDEEVGVAAVCSGRSDGACRWLNNKVHVYDDDAICDYCSSESA